MKKSLFDDFVRLGVFPFAMHFIVGFVTMLVFQDAGVFRWYWLAGLATVLSLQVVVLGRYRSAAVAPTVDQAIAAFTALNFAIGLVWGAAAWVFLVPDAPTTTLFFVFVTGGLIISSVATQHMLLRFCFAASFTAYALLVALLLVRPFPNGPQMAFLLVLFCIVMAELARRLQALLLTRIELQRDKDRLLGELETSLQQLQDAQSDRARFLAQASHDLRQPVHAAALLTEVLANKAALPEVSQLRAAIGNLVTMLEGLMDLSLFDGGNLEATFEPVAVGPALLDVCESFASAAEEADIEFRFVNSSLHARADPALLKRILVNLVGNAVRYAPRGGLLVGVRRRAGALYIHVIDTGPGISDADRLRAFEAFTRLPRGAGDQGPGLGLGLSIVANAAAAMGASCEIRTGPGGGCDFCLGPFSIVEGQTAPARRPAFVVESGEGAIVLDDDAQAAQALSALLQTWGYAVETHLSPDTLPADLSAKVLIFDNDLQSDRTGLEILAGLNEAQSADAARVLITGNMSAELRETARGQGIPVLSKPVQPAKLRSLLRQLASRQEITRSGGSGRP